MSIGGERVTCKAFSREWGDSQFLHRTESQAAGEIESTACDMLAQIEGKPSRQQVS